MHCTNTFKNEMIKCLINKLLKICVMLMKIVQSMKSVAICIDSFHVTLHTFNPGPLLYIGNS